MFSNKDFSLMQTFSISENEQGLAPLRIALLETSWNWFLHGLFPILLKCGCAGFPFTSLRGSDFQVTHLQKESCSAQGLCFPSTSLRPLVIMSKALGSVRTHCGQHRSLQTQLQKTLMSVPQDYFDFSLYIRSLVQMWHHPGRKALWNWLEADIVAGWSENENYCHFCHGKECWVPSHAGKNLSKSVRMFVQTFPWVKT